MSDGWAIRRAGKNCNATDRRAWRGVRPQPNHEEGTDFSGNKWVLPTLKWLIESGGISSGGISSAFIFRPPFFASFWRIDRRCFTKRLAKNEGRKIGTPATQVTTGIENGPFGTEKSSRENKIFTVCRTETFHGSTHRLDGRR